MQFKSATPDTNISSINKCTLQYHLALNSNIGKNAVNRKYFGKD